MHFWPLKTTPSTVCYLFSAASKYESKNKNQGANAFMTSTWIEHATLRFGIWCTTTVLRSQDVGWPRYWDYNLTNSICFSNKILKNLSITIVSLPAKLSWQFQWCPSITLFSLHILGHISVLSFTFSIECLQFDYYRQAVPHDNIVQGLLLSLIAFDEICHEVIINWHHMWWAEWMRVLWLANLKIL